MKYSLKFEDIKSGTSFTPSYIIENYTHIRMYHCGRPISIDDFLCDGIRAVDEKYIKERIEQLNIDLETKNCIMIDATVALRDLESSDNKVWLGFSSDFLIRNCGHYLIYGSEFLLGIIHDPYIREKLTEIGMPTVFNCDIPISRISRDVLESLCINISYNIHNDTSFSFDQIYSNEIISYSNPTEIIDPFLNKIYHFKK